MIELAIAVLDNGGTIDTAAISLSADGYDTLSTLDATGDTVLYGNARIDVTADNMADYQF